MVSILLMNGCMNDSTGNTQQFSNALISVEFLHTENDEPIIDELFFVQLRETGTTDPVDIGEYTSDENGRIEVELSSTIETSINLIRIQYMLNGEVEIIDEEIDLELRYTQPFDEENLQILIEGLLEEEEENGDEENVD